VSTKPSNLFYHRKQNSKWLTADFPLIPTAGIFLTIPPMDYNTEEPRWSALLQESRDARQETTSKEFVSPRLKMFQSRFPAWKDQLVVYTTVICQENGAVAVQWSQPGRKKELVLETRSALRFGLSCLSFEDDGIRQSMQNKAVLTCEWHKTLASLLSQKRTDVKTRLIAAKLFSNLVTGNLETARRFASDLPLSPSKADVSSRIVDNLSEAQSASEAGLFDPNWVDMIIFCARSGDRETLAAVTAALHNCILSLDDEPSESDSKTNFIEKVSSNSILISTLLRQLVSVDSVKKSVENQEADDGTEYSDSATEWIYLLLTKLSRSGMFPQIYHAIGGKDTHGDHVNTILPEQVVLLHCMAKEAKDCVARPESKLQTGNPFGGENGWDSIIASHVFLAELFSRLRKRFESTEETACDESDSQLAHSAIVAILDMLAASLGLDNPCSEKLRLHLGTKTNVVQESSKDLGTMVDLLSDRYFGIKTREQKMSDEEQQMITALVILQANLCFRCEHNQDLMRLIEVPVTRSTKDDKNSSAPLEKRTALHALLSTSSFATACFTLREWSVIAIRNVLENNQKNQDIVAALEAQQPMQGPELNRAGVRVNLDEEGKVSLGLSTTAEESDNKE
jgi:hypothetical protein